MSRTIGEIEMAIVRCVEHKPKGRSEPYVMSLNTVGYPNTAAICGREGCEKPGLVWLTEDERQQYVSGRRVFGFNTAVIKVRVG